MPEFKNRILKLIQSNFPAIGASIVVLLALLLLWRGNATSNQAHLAMVAQVYFDGEYRIADGVWQDIEEGKHISSTQGDVTLRGNFHLLTPDGEYIGLYTGDMPIALYTDHINLTFYEQGNDPYVVDMENPAIGQSACGKGWFAYTLMNQDEQPLEIRIHNPHHFGNENAIDDLLSSTALWAGLEFEKGILNSGVYQRNTGIFFMIVSLALIGIALFSTLIHIKINKLLWIFGTVILFAGLYFAYSASGIYFWSESIVSNTIILGSSMMFYMFFLSIGIVYFLTTTQQIGKITITCLGVLNSLFFILPIVTNNYFYDTWLYWTICQCIVNLVLFICIIKEFISKKENNNWLYMGAILPLAAFILDAAMTYQGTWQGGTISKYVFIVLFVITMVVVLRIIPNSINAAEKAKELELQRGLLEAELKESRVAIMLSQIQPHFIYNTLGTIERMCLKDPEKAFNLVRNFSLYLRGNFSELDSIKPIRFTEELKHVEHYVNIEKVRFPDMTIEYDIEATDFVIPALSVQPLVENAIKHGLMRLESGGTVLIHSYETATHYCVEVKDDGVGFDPALPIDEKKHVGLRNIKGRLKAIVDGELIIDSKPNEGTKAIIMIPKEG